MFSSNQSPSSSSSQSRIKECEFQQNTINQHQYFEMLEKIKKKRLQPEIQINIAQSICIGLDNMSCQEFTQFNYHMFIEKITSYDWNNIVVVEFLQQAIDKTLRLKYQYDRWLDQIKQQQQEPIWIENSRRSNFSFGYKQEAPSDVSDLNSVTLQSEFQSPQMVPQRQTMVSSQCILDADETKNMVENYFTPNNQSNQLIQAQSPRESKESNIINSKNSMHQSSNHKQ